MNDLFPSKAVPVARCVDDEGIESPMIGRSSTGTHLVASLPNKTSYSSLMQHRCSNADVLSYRDASPMCRASTFAVCLIQWSKFCEDEVIH